MPPTTLYALPVDKHVFSWGGGAADGNASMRNILGGKGANLAEMARIQLPVPPGFTIASTVCTLFHEGNCPIELKNEIQCGIKKIENLMHAGFGATNGLPLLLAVRSGARESMPGMLDTVLNLGLNDDTVDALTHATLNERFAWDCYRRFIQTYADVVLGIHPEPNEDQDPFEQIIEQVKQERFGNRHASDSELTCEDLRTIVGLFKNVVLNRTQEPFPTDPYTQLNRAIQAVFASWMNERAVHYRRRFTIPDDWGTAVNVQAMVFGNTGPNSGSGVAFTRDPSTGENRLYGEFLPNAQGEDVVAGVRTPLPIQILEARNPAIHQELIRISEILESHFQDMQDFEFTVQNGQFFMLQTRTGKRTGTAAVRIAHEMLQAGLIDKPTAIARVKPEDIAQMLAPVFDPERLKEVKPLDTGLPAGPGAAIGRVYLTAAKLVEASKMGIPTILVRPDTMPEDVQGIMLANGILTARGGASCHAALIARQMSKVCICGTPSLRIDLQRGVFEIGSCTFKEGDYLSIDGRTGSIYAGTIPTKEPSLEQIDPRLAEFITECQPTPKPCPQCGNPELELHFGGTGPTPAYNIQCASCGLAGPKAFGSSRADHVEAQRAAAIGWNDQPGPEPKNPGN